MKIKNLLSEKEGMWLISYIRTSIKTILEKKPSQSPASSPISDSLYKKIYGIFITLQKEGKIRGCFGSPYPTKSVLETIQEMLIKSSLEDPRFPPLSSEELLQIEISILTPPTPIEPDQVQLGLHGLIVSHKEKKALFLPKTALNHGWAMETFLEQLCLKAQLPKNAWEKGATLSAFQTQIFSD